MCKKLTVWLTSAKTQHVLAYTLGHSGGGLTLPPSPTWLARSSWDWGGGWAQCRLMWLEAAEPSSSALYSQTKQRPQAPTSVLKASTLLCLRTKTPTSNAPPTPSSTNTHIHIHTHGYTQLATVKACYVASQCKEKEEKYIYRWIRWTY